METHTSQNYWLNKTAKIEILKDQKKLVFTALILEIDHHSVTFRDRDNIIYSFNRELIKEMKNVEGNLQ